MLSSTKIESFIVGIIVVVVFLALGVGAWVLMQKPANLPGAPPDKPMPVSGCASTCESLGYPNYITTHDGTCVCTRNP